MIIRLTKKEVIKLKILSNELAERLVKDGVYEPAVQSYCLNDSNLSYKEIALVKSITKQHEF